MMRIPIRHRWLTILAVLCLALAVPSLQGAGLHLHHGDSHGSSPHMAQDPAHTHHHDEAGEVDLTPQATVKSGVAADISFAALPALSFDALVPLGRHSQALRFLLAHVKSPPPWLAPPLRAPPA